MRWPIFFIFLIGFSSCRNNNQELFFAETEVRFTVPSGLDNLLTHIFIIEDVPSTLEAFANQNSVSLDFIDRVNPSTAVLEGLFEDGNYKNLNEVVVNIVDPENPNNKREVFFQQIIDFNHDGPLNLFGSLGDILPFLSKDQYDLEIEMRFRAPTTRTIENRLILNYVAMSDE